MGETLWRHAPSLDAMRTAERLYLTTMRTSPGFHLLSPAAPKKVAALRQEVNLADRTTMTNDSYPDFILGKKPDLSNGYAFLTPPYSAR